MQWRTKNGLVLQSLLAMGLLAVGCSKTSPPPSQTTGPITMYTDLAKRQGPPEVSYEDPRLREALITLTPTRIRSRGYLRIDVPIENKTDQTITFDYAIRFVDQTGAPLDPEPHWMAALLDAREVVSLIDQTSDRRAQHFRLEIRPSSLLAVGNDGSE